MKALFALALPLLIAAAPPASVLERNMAAVLPKPEEERWLQIPWRTHVMQARDEAQKQGKPLFLWVMNGNPLGCT